MPIFVDNIKTYPNTKLRQKQWCHCVSDLDGAEGTEELLDFARSLGLKDIWLQHAGKHTEHFDLTPAKRALAIKLGATEISSRDLVRNITLKKMRKNDSVVIYDGGKSTEPSK